MKDKLNTIALFIEAARWSSFSVAARQLGLSPSSVSKAIQRLESELDTRLFERTTRKIRLTQDGAVFFNRCTKILAELEAAELELSQARSRPQGLLRIDLNISLGQRHIVPALAIFLQTYPDIQIDISLSDRTVDLIESGIDAVVRIGGMSDSRLMMRPLATTKFVICAAPAYLDRHGTPKTPEDLSKHNCLNFIYPQTRKQFDWIFQRNGKVFRLPVRGNFAIDHPDAHLSAAIAGIGIVQELSFIVGPAIAQGQLVAMLQDYIAPGEIISVIYPQKQYVSGKVQVFLDFLKALMDDLKQANLVE
ncbi:MAG: LysR family transcriptional regulator [Synechococcales cyanobacterium CRU_2_2]|nr:LysR family transcriptional regulator [Synechococcales cyanobacterium CRU_2_2]